MFCGPWNIGAGGGIPDGGGYVAGGPGGGMYDWGTYDGLGGITRDELSVGERKAEDGGLELGGGCAWGIRIPTGGWIVMSGCIAICPAGGKAGSGTGDNMRCRDEQAGMALTLRELMVNEITQCIQITLNTSDFVASLVHVSGQPLIEVSQIANQFLLLVSCRPLSNLIFLFWEVSPFIRAWDCFTHSQQL
jgi:hypothetical protein